MKNRLEDVIQGLEEKIKKKNIKKGLSEEVLTRIQFFQHERLVHLIVTFMTGVAMILFLLGFIAFEMIPLLVLFIISICLFIPYIFHYYKFENGTQKLYELYFKIKDIE